MRGHVHDGHEYFATSDQRSGPLTWCQRLLWNDAQWLAPMMRTSTM